ncbi:MAG: hypothetical protein WCJ26_12585 [bacterium]
MKKEKTEFKFSIAFDGKPEKKIELEALLFHSNGRLLERKSVTEGVFSMSLPSEAFRTSRLFICPVNPKSNNEDIQLADVLRRNPYEPIIPTKISDIIKLNPIPELIWCHWFFCHCHIHGRVWNHRCDPPSLVPHARIHICEVDSVLYWIHRLPEIDIFKIRDDIRHLIAIPEIDPIPGPDPGPERYIKKSVISVLEKKIELPDIEAVKRLKDNMPSKNLMQFYSTSAAHVREYLLENIHYFRPLFCHFHWWWLRCDEIGVVETNDFGAFEMDYWYFCWDKPDLYFWVEYCINGVWQTVYRPDIGCHTWWEYNCNTEINIYLNDSRIPCSSNNNVPGKVVVITTIGNNVNVNQISQTPGVERGLMPGRAPFGGTLEPRALFGDLLGAGNFYYRWSYRREGEGELDWKRLNTSVGRHYWKLTPDGSGGWIYSFPVHPLGPHNVGSALDVFEVQKAQSPINTLWAITDNRYDLPTAFFMTYQLNNSNVAIAAGFYELKFELFDSVGNLVDFTASGIDLLVIDNMISAPFGSQTLTTVAPPPINRIVNGSGHLIGYKLLIRVDNNPVQASITPITSDGSGSCGTGVNCGFIPFLTLNSPVHIQYIANHPNDFATFGFSVNRGSSGQVHSASGNLLDPIPSISTSGAAPLPPGVTENPATDQFTYDLKTGDLLGPCSKAAFGCWLGVYGTANDGYGRLGYDNSASQAFALISQGDCS